MRSDYRWLNFTGFALCAGALTFAVLYLEGVLGLEPCPLCMMVRLLVLTSAALFLLAWLHNPASGGQKVYAALNMVIIFCGLLVSGRHTWLQTLPADQVPSCGPGLDYLLYNFPITEAFTVIMKGSGECADIKWQFLGLTLPQQSFLFFVLLLIILVIQFRKRAQRSVFS